MTESDSKRTPKFPQNNLRRLREAAGYRSADDFAAACTQAGVKVGASMVRQIEASLRRLTDKYVAVFCEVLDCTPAELTGFQAQAPAPIQMPTLPTMATPVRSADEGADYGEREYFRDLIALTKALYSEIGLPQPDSVTAVIAFDILRAAPWAGIRARQSPAVRQQLDLRRRILSVAPAEVEARDVAE